MVSPSDTVEQSSDRAAGPVGRGETGLQSRGASFPWRPTASQETKTARGLQTREPESGQGDAHQRHSREAQGSSHLHDPGKARAEMGRSAPDSERAEGGSWRRSNQDPGPGAEDDTLGTTWACRASSLPRYGAPGCRQQPPHMKPWVTVPEGQTVWTQRSSRLPLP